jgi:hypothetical protein
MIKRVYTRLSDQNVSRGMQLKWWMTTGKLLAEDKGVLKYS